MTTVCFRRLTEARERTTPASWAVDTLIHPGSGSLAGEERAPADSTPSRGSVEGSQIRRRKKLTNAKLPPPKPIKQRLEGSGTNSNWRVITTPTLVFTAPRPFPEELVNDEFATAPTGRKRGPGPRNSARSVGEVRKNGPNDREPVTGMARLVGEVPVRATISGPLKIGPLMSAVLLGRFKPRKALAVMVIVEGEGVVNAKSNSKIGRASCRE